jgi:ABC-type uncharacterized transport system involved in gliding motility auxiliary subunit
MKKAAMNKYYKFLIYLVVVILVNIAGITMFFRADLTSSNVYSLSEASKDVAATLSEPLTVKVFFNNNLPAPYNNIERYLHDLLEEYSITGGRHFNYQFYNVSAEQDEESDRNKELASSYGIQPVQIQNIEQDEVKFQKAYMGMVLIHGDIIETLPTITSTEGIEYKITSAIRKMNDKISALLRLKGKIQIKLLLSSSLGAVGPYMNIQGLSSLPGKIEKIVANLNEINFGRLEFIHLDPTMNPGLEQEAEHYNVVKLNWNTFTDRRGRTVSADRGYAGIIVEHEDRFENIKLIDIIRLPLFGTQYQLADLEDLENSIDETVENVIDINEKIGYLADHGTPSLEGGRSFPGQMPEGSLSSFNSLLSENYSVRQINLKEEGIPEGLSFLTIAGAKENFSDYELYQIDQFLMKGKSLAIFMDAFNEVSPQGRQGAAQFQRSVHVPLNTGLEKLLGHYGMSVKHSIILDENSYKQKAPRALGGGENTIYFAPIIKNELINKEAAYLENIKGLVMLKSSPVEVNEEKVKDHGLKATRLFSSSERSWEMSERINLNPMFIRPPRGDGEFRSIPMAYVLEGPLPSYFADKPVPEKEKPEDEETAVSKEAQQDVRESGIDMSEITGKDVTIKKGRPAKIFLIGTSEILKDNVLDKEGRTPNSQFVLNIIDYLNNREQIAVMRSKTQRFNPLREVSPAVRTTIKTVNIAGLPVLVVIAGVIVWGRRASRKRMIQKMFVK